MELELLDKYDVRDIVRNYLKEKLTVSVETNWKDCDERIHIVKVKLLLDDYVISESKTELHEQGVSH